MEHLPPITITAISHDNVNGLQRELAICFSKGYESSSGMYCKLNDKKRIWIDLKWSDHYLKQYNDFFNF